MFSASAVRRLSHIPGPVRASPRAATKHGGLLIERREGGGEVERWRGLVIDRREGEVERWRGAGHVWTVHIQMCFGIQFQERQTMVSRRFLSYAG